MNTDVSDTTLIVLGHGSTKNPDSGRPALTHAGAIRRMGRFADVRAGFWKQEPYIADVLAEIATSRVIIVPLFISEGYFSEQAIPEALGFKQPGEESWSRERMDGETKFTYTKVVGTHEKMTEVLLARAADVVDAFPFPRKARPEQTSLFIAGHGTPQNAESRRSIERQVKLVRARNLYAEVVPCFLEEEPLIADVPKLARSRNIVMVPFFMSDGMHTVEDIPMLLGEPERIVRKRLDAGQATWRNPTEKNGKLIWCSPAVGTDPRMVDVILDRVAESV